MHQAIHKLFVLMWLTGTTPDSWKESNTILLHKKNSELLLENYRPIALANTMYKLWTSLIQESLGQYAEYYDILSTSQEGFRHGRGTMRQLHNLVNVLSDAKKSEQNLYMLYVDFSAAFNTIDHDKLLQIMYDLGFPTDAIYVIANLYTNATTCVKLPGGKTQRDRTGGQPVTSAIFDLYRTNAEMVTLRRSRAVKAPYNDHTGLQQFGHYSALFNRYNDM